MPYKLGPLEASTPEIKKAGGVLNNTASPALEAVRALAEATKKLQEAIEENREGLDLEPANEARDEMEADLEKISSRMGEAAQLMEEIGPKLGALGERAVKFAGDCEKIIPRYHEMERGMFRSGS